MPSSIGHALGGYAAAQLVAPRCTRRVWPALLLANVPDVDIAPGLARRQPNAYHGRATHSLGAALAAGAVTGAVGRLGGGCFAPCFIAGAAVYGSHLVLDYLSKESEDGLPLLWPLSHRRYAAPRPIFRTIRTRREKFFTGLFTRRGNAGAVAREVALLLPVALLARAFRRRR